MAVYKCIIPVKKPLIAPSVIYHSLFTKSRKGTLPYPAWPEIDEANRPCCLPTIRRAVYFLDRGVRTESEEAIALAEEYLSQQDSIEPEIREKALDYSTVVICIWQPQRVR
jgi:hypothetical protein